MSPTTGPTKTSFHVLVTGYGRFSRIVDNPSWLCLTPLHNTIIQTASASIHITAVGPIKVAYDAVLSLVPGLHARPPRIPSSGSKELDAPILEPVVEPPAEGYDFIFHLGAGYNGALSLEQIGHKSGYRSPDVDGKLPPIISIEGVLQAPSAAEKFETERLRRDADPSGDSEPNGEASTGSDEPSSEPIRGFAAGYERFPEELRTEIDVQAVIEHLKEQGETRVRASVDAGHYLCDFICYGSLAESQRPLFYPSGDDKGTQRSKVLFMHVPYDIGYPHTLKEMSEAVRQIVAWVCAKEKAEPSTSH